MMKTIITTLVLMAGFVSKAQAKVDNPGGFFPEPGGGDIKGLLYWIINQLLGLAGIVAILFLIIGGYQYIFSGASEESAEKGKKTLTNAVIGLIIVVLSYTIISVVYRTVV